MNIKIIATVGLFVLGQLLTAQNEPFSIFELLNRQDLNYLEIQKIADKHYANADKGQGSGYNHYQRWLYEQKFHTNDQGYRISPQQEDQAYYNSDAKRQQVYRSTFLWKELGPDRKTQTSAWSPGVGRITSVAIHPADTTIIYVSSPGGGIWKSINSGQSWTPLIDFINSGWLNIYNLCIDPNNQNIIYAAVVNGGVIKSTNAGATWAATGSGPSGSDQVRVHPDSSNIVFCASNNGVWRSINGGALWIRTHTIEKEDIEFNPNNPNIMYVAGRASTNAIFRSIDNGKNWTGINLPGGGRTLMAVCQNNPAIVYAAQANGDLFGRMYKSSDTGKTFVTLIIGNATNGTNFFGYNTDGKSTNGQANYDMAICVNPLDSNEVHIGGINTWKSTDGAKTFSPETYWITPSSFGYVHADVHSLVWVNNSIYCTSDGGIFRSTNNGNSWVDLTVGIGIKQIYRISNAVTDKDAIVLGSQDNGSSFRQPNGVWFDWLGADGMDNVISPTNAKISIGTSQYGNIYRTTNGGLFKQDLTRPIDGNWITPIVMHPKFHDTVYGGWRGVYRSSNMGNNWTKISGNISNAMNCLAMGTNNTRFIYASAGASLFKTANGGLNWDTTVLASTITSIFVSEFDAGKVWITLNSTANRVFASIDSGNTFTNISLGLPAMAARSIVVDEMAAETIYVGMNIGVFYRDTITKLWKEHATGLPMVAVNEVEIQKSSNKLRVATYGRGVWESYLQNVPYSCSSPLGLITVNLMPDAALLRWNNVPFGLNYKVEYKLVNDSNWIVLANNIKDSFIALTDLQRNQNYQWRVMANCEGNLESGLSNGNFKTKEFFVDVPLLEISAAQNQLISIAPNPANNILILKYSLLGEEQIGEVKIFDNTGKAVLGRIIKNGQKGENKLSLDISSLSAGNYTLQLGIGSYIANNKFIIIK